MLALWRFTTEKRLTEEMLSGLTDLQSVLRWREAVLFAQGKLVHRAYRGSQARFAGRGRRQAGEQWRHVRHARSARRVEADVSRDLAFAARFSLRSALSRARSGEDRGQVPALPRWPGVARRVHLLVRSRCSAKFKSGTCSCAVRARRPDAPKPGLLGADYTVDHDRYRFAKIYNGQNWTPSLTAPLTLPGINVVEGDYLLAVNGARIACDRQHRRLLRRHGGQADGAASVAKSADGSDARDVTVVPVDSEHGLRNLDWIDAESAQGRCAVGRQGRLHLHAEHGRRRLHELQPLLLCAARQAGGGARRALQRGRLHRRLRRQRAGPEAA